MDAFHTPSSATAALPLVRPILADMVARFQELRAAGRVRAQLRLDGVPEDAAPLAECSALLARLSEQTKRHVDELGALGLVVADLEHGVVLFPTLLGGELGYLVHALGDMPYVSTWTDDGGLWTARRDVLEVFGPLVG